VRSTLENAGLTMDGGSSGIGILEFTPRRAGQDVMPARYDFVHNPTATRSLSGECEQCCVDACATPSLLTHVVRCRFTLCTIDLVGVVNLIVLSVP
jgi:hypothetical protein